MKFLHVVSLLFALGIGQELRAQTPLNFAVDDGTPPYSYVSPSGAPVGLFPDLLKALFAKLPEYSVKMTAYPWARAQVMVQQGSADGFLTYPSEKRQTYAVFNTAPVFVEDIGFLVFRPDNPHAEALRKVRRFEDLRPFLMLGSSASDWEKDNLPSYIRRESILKDESRVNVLVNRRHGDYMIMGRENANHLLSKVNYKGRVEFKKVDFIPDSQVPFHIGISRSRPDAADVIRKINSVLDTPEVKAQLQKIQLAYQAR